MKTFAEWVAVKEASMSSADADQLSQMGIDPSGFRVRKPSWLSNKSELPDFTTNHGWPSASVDQDPDDHRFLVKLLPIYRAIETLRPEMKSRDIWALLRHANKAMLYPNKNLTSMADEKEHSLEMARTILGSIGNREDRLRGSRT